MQKRNRSQKNSNELILQHFILGIIILVESLIKVLNLTIPRPSTKKKSIEVSDEEKDIKNSQEVELSKKILSKKNEKQLKSLLNEIDIVYALDRDQITKLILSNQKAINLLMIESRKENLKRMKNEELRSLLKGIKGISNLNKSQLVEIILKKDKVQLPKIN